MVKDDPQIMTGYIYISTVASYLLTPQIATHVYASRGENRANVLAVFENTHILSVTCTFTLRHWVRGVGNVNVHVNLRHMHI